MSVIGTFTPSKEGRWIGTIHTLLMNTKLRLVPNENRRSENAPAGCWTKGQLVWSRQRLCSRTWRVSGR
jgi:uncharacterized protein (DUF736 family)